MKNTKSSLSRIVDFNSREEKIHPLDCVEDLLLVTPYECNREGNDRLTFYCDGQGGRYHLALDWHDEFKAMRCVLIRLTQDRTAFSKDIIETANVGAWNGYFMFDENERCMFKSVQNMNKNANQEDIVESVESLIDRSIDEMDKLCLMCGYQNEQQDMEDFFLEDDYVPENLALFFADVKGNA